jgi:uncharacterized protein YkwD
MKILFLLTTIVLISKGYQKESSKNEKEIRKLDSLDLDKIKKEILSTHNYHRSRHQVDDLKWNNEIQVIAQAYSEKIAPGHSLVHSSNTYKGQSLGENLYMSYGGISGEQASNSWYNEVNNYDFSSHSSLDGKVTGHFTQLVWKESKEIGCGSACDGTYCICCCNYYPAGNFIGNYDSNVSPLKIPVGGGSIVSTIFGIIFLILVLALFAFAVFHFIYKNRNFADLPGYLKGSNK